MSTSRNNIAAIMLYDELLNSLMSGKNSKQESQQMRMERIRQINSYNGGSAVINDCIALINKDVQKFEHDAISTEPLNTYRNPNALPDAYTRFFRSQTDIRLHLRSELSSVLTESVVAARCRAAR